MTWNLTFLHGFAPKISFAFKFKVIGNLLSFYRVARFKTHRLRVRWCFWPSWIASSTMVELRLEDSTCRHVRAWDHHGRSRDPHYTTFGLPLSYSKPWISSSGERNIACCDIILWCSINCVIHHCSSECYENTSSVATSSNLWLKFSVGTLLVYVSVTEIGIRCHSIYELSVKVFFLTKIWL